MLAYETETRAYIASLASHAITTGSAATKDERRALLAARKRDVLVRHRDQLLRVEARALAALATANQADPDPVLVHCADRDMLLWSYLYAVLSSAPTGAFFRPGRRNRFFCVDKPTGGVLGIVEAGSDMQNLVLRDAFIGWSKERKYKGYGLRYLANLAVCVCAPVFGSLCGGKFLAEACTTTILTDFWPHRYGHPLAGITVTSLFGKSSVYNRLPSYAYLGETMGWGTAHVTPHGVHLLQRFLDANHVPSRVGGTGLAPDSRSDVLERACEVLRIERGSVASQQPRGVYFAALGADALAFLRSDVDAFAPDRRDQADVARWWRDRWYTMRRPKVDPAFDVSQFRYERQLDACARASRVLDAELVA